MNSFFSFAFSLSSLLVFLRFRVPFITHSFTQHLCVRRVSCTRTFWMVMNGTQVYRVIPLHISCCHNRLPVAYGAHKVSEKRFFCFQVCCVCVCAFGICSRSPAKWETMPRRTKIISQALFFAFFRAMNFYFYINGVGKLLPVQVERVQDHKHNITRCASATVLMLHDNKFQLCDRTMTYKRP